MVNTVRINRTNEVRAMLTFEGESGQDDLYGPRTAVNEVAIHEQDML